MELVAIIAAISALTWHLVLWRYWFAVLGSAVTALVLFWAIVLAMGGFGGVHNFLIEATLIPLAVAGSVSVVVGAILRHFPGLRH